MQHLKPIAIIILSIILNTLQAQDVYHIWKGQKIPYFKENSLTEYEKESWGTMCVFDVTDPTLTVYKAKGENSGKAVIILPGGRYNVEAIYHEGHDLAKVLSRNGITAAVLKYRLPNPKSSDQPQLVPLSDTRHALRLIRQMAKVYGVNKNEVGVIGFSAGSHLATVASLWRSKKKMENPNFSGLIYGVTDLSEENIKWLEENLYHRKMTEEEIEDNTLLNLVDEDTPPTFLVHAYDDEVCRVVESTGYADKLIENNVSVEMHLFQIGGHGFGTGRAEDGTNQWVPLFISWVKRIDF